jgi:hypothetical protein
MVGAHAAPSLLEGPMRPSGEAKVCQGGSRDLVLTLQGSGEAEIVLDGVQESGTLMTSWGLRQGRNQH